MLAGFDLFQQCVALRNEVLHGLRIFAFCASEAKLFHDFFALQSSLFTAELQVDSLAYEHANIEQVPCSWVLEGHMLQGSEQWHFRRHVDFSARVQGWSHKL